MNPDGHHIGGLVGFLRSLGYVTRIFDPTRVIIIWDGKGGSGNRQNIDPNYKAQRANTRITHWGLYDNKEQETEALVGQLLRVQDYIECLPIHQISLEKLEADDIIAVLSKKLVEKYNSTCFIVSSDKDFVQLVSDKIILYRPMEKEYYNAGTVKEKFGVLANNFILYKTLFTFTL